MLAILAVLTLAVSAVVVCVIRRQRRRKVVTSRAGAGENNGFVNVIYGGMHRYTYIYLLAEPLK